MIKIAKYTFRFLVGYLVINLLAGHIPFLRERSIQNQINYISKALNANQDSTLQTQYPEGKAFGNAIFALALIEYSTKIETHEINFSNTIDACITELLSPSTKKYFHKNLSPNYGAFYNGWTNYCLLKYSQSPAFDHSRLQEYFSKYHDSLSQVLINTQKDSLKLLESYSEASWPADNIVCIASLGSKNEALQKDWVNLIQNTSTIKGNLIHHYNASQEELRGSSQALMLHFLSGIDSTLSKKMQEEFNSRMVDQLLGIQFVKEYENPDQEGDIDSGPIIFDYGSVATIVNVKASAQSDPIKAKMTWSFLNSLGLPINLFKNKYYLFKQELIFDIFMLWTCISIM